MKQSLAKIKNFAIIILGKSFITRNNPPYNGVNLILLTVIMVPCSINGD